MESNRVKFITWGPGVYSSEEVTSPFCLKPKKKKTPVEWCMCRAKELAKQHNHKLAQAVARLISFIYIILNSPQLPLGQRILQYTFCDLAEGCGT